MKYWFDFCLGIIIISVFSVLLEKVDLSVDSNVLIVFVALVHQQSNYLHIRSMNVTLVLVYLQIVSMNYVNGY